MPSVSMAAATALALESTRQRFLAIPFDYPQSSVEAEIVAHESGCDIETAHTLVRIGTATRTLREQGLREGASTRLLIYAAQLHEQGLPVKTACTATLVESLTDDPELIHALRDLLDSILG